MERSYITYLPFPTQLSQSVSGNRDQAPLHGYLTPDARVHHWPNVGMLARAAPQWADRQLPLSTDLEQRYNEGTGKNANLGKPCLRKDERRMTMMLIGIILVIIVLVTAVYGFGYFDTPYMGTFRVAFYFFLIFFLATLAVGVVFQPNQGYDPTPHSRENPAR